MTLFDKDISVDSSSAGSPGGAPVTSISTILLGKVPVIPKVLRIRIHFKISKGWVIVTGGNPSVDWSKLEKP